MILNLKKHHKESFKDCLIVCNPNRKPNEVTRLSNILKYVDLEPNSIIKTNPVITKSGSHLEEMVFEFYKSHYKHLIVFGGDGTVHITVNSAMKAKQELSLQGYVGLDEKSIGFFRGGSGNGIQDSYEVPFGLYSQVVAFAESLHNDYTIDVDLLAVDFLKNDNLFTIYSQLIGFGLDSLVLQKRDQNVYKRGPRAGSPKSGLMNYVKASIETLLFDFNSAFVEFDIIMNEGKYAPRGTRSNVEIPFGPGNRLPVMERHVNALMVEIGSRPYYGKMFKVCPDVVCNDGNMGLYVFDFNSKFKLMRNFLDLYLGEHGKINRRETKHSNKPPIERYEVRDAQVISQKPFNFHIDGDLYSSPDKTDEGHSLYFSVAPEALRFLVPPSFYLLSKPFN
ncbi:sphingosine kinase [Candidatus Woesearchaeota archaeon]|nr:sphingosine kinase [Candidatus Woesearchaeota archaeon]